MTSKMNALNLNHIAFNKDLNADIRHRDSSRTESKKTSCPTRESESHALKLNLAKDDASYTKRSRMCNHTSELSVMYDKLDENIQESCLQNPFMDAFLKSFRIKSNQENLVDDTKQAATLILSESEMHIMTNDNASKNTSFSDISSHISEQNCHNIHSNNHRKCNSAKSTKELEQRNNITRLVAPHVDKLSESSRVEIRIQGEEEIVSVLCSADVLKMRSAYFLEILKAGSIQQGRTQGASTKNAEGRLIIAPVILQDKAPFECASFLQSLHDGKNISSDVKWSLNWIRLSVIWRIDDVLESFARLMDVHIENVLSRLKLNCWRTNSDVLVGFRVAIFQRSSAFSPTFMLGTVVDSAVPTKLRVHLDDKVSVSKSRLPSYGNSTPNSGSSKETSWQTMERNNTLTSACILAPKSGFKAGLGNILDESLCGVEQSHVTIDTNEQIW